MTEIHVLSPEGLTGLFAPRYMAPLHANAEDGDVVVVHREPGDEGERLVCRFHAWGLTLYRELQ